MKSQKPPTLALLILTVAGAVAGTLLVTTTPTRTSEPDPITVIESPAIMDSQGMKATTGGLALPRPISVSESNSAPAAPAAPGRVQGVKIVNVNN